MDGQRLEHLVRLLRPRVGHQLHLVELVLADETPGFLSVRPRLPAEAGRLGHELERQGVGRDDLVPVEVGDRHLGGGYQPEVVFIVVVKVVGELGQVAGAYHGLLFDH